MYGVMFMFHSALGCSMNWKENRFLALFTFMLNNNNISYRKPIQRNNIHKGIKPFSFDIGSAREFPPPPPSRQHLNME